jgi:hypothetical protein
VCVFYDATPGAEGPLVYRTTGSSTQLIRMSRDGFIWNNGTFDPYFDHIQAVRMNSAGVVTVICLHYGAARYIDHVTMARLDAGDTLLGLTWRGECAPHEDVWHSP